MPMIEALVQQLPDFSGMQGCALVDADAGMTWHHAGTLADIEQIGEAAVEFRRVQRRLPVYLQNFGPLRSSAHSFYQRVIAIFPCSQEPELVLVRMVVKQTMDWARWGENLLLLKEVFVPGSVELAGRQPV
jgi:hypothetical protein